MWGSARGGGRSAATQGQSYSMLVQVQCGVVSSTSSAALRENHRPAALTRGKGECELMPSGLPFFGTKRNKFQ